jgi:integrase
MHSISVMKISKKKARMSLRRLKAQPAIILKEQRRLLTVIEHGEFERPCGKTIKKYFGGDTRAYGGRKGFVDLMLRRGQSIENISQWLGHRSIERTWANYTPSTQLCDIPCT